MKKKVVVDLEAQRRDMLPEQLKVLLDIGSSRLRSRGLKETIGNVRGRIWDAILGKTYDDWMHYYTAITGDFNKNGKSRFSYRYDCVKLIE